MKKTSLSLLALLCAMTFSPINVLAATTYSTEIVNSISVGDINIGIEESEDTSKGKVVLPGQKIEKTIKVKNKANKAWIRAKIEYSDCGNSKGLSNDEIEIASSKWKRVGDYYYYIDPVEKGDVVDLIKSIRIPANWDSEKAGTQFNVYTSVDAVQFSHFTPDFESADPWFGTVIEECVHSEQDMKQVRDNQCFSIIFEQGSRGLVKIEDDFFSDWGSLMPGDTVYGKMTIGNNYDRPVYMYFRSETTMDDDLAGKINLTIMNGTKEVYNGPLNGAIHDIKLGMFLKGNEKEYTYKIYVPEDLTNKYALSTTETKWIFTGSYNDYRRDESSGGGDSSTGKTPAVLGDNRPTQSQTEETSENETSGDSEITEVTDDPNVPTDTTKCKAPATGDTSQMMLYFWSMVFFGVSALAMIIYNWRQNRRDENE